MNRESRGDSWSMGLLRRLLEPHGAGEDARATLRGEGDEGARRVVADPERIRAARRVEAGLAEADLLELQRDRGVECLCDAHEGGAREHGERLLDVAEERGAV